MMELEQRVQALEQELQILKNQIQVMLLDIQEQVLSNTYPDLRSGDSTPQANRPVSRPEPEAEAQKRPSSPVHKVSFDDFRGEEQRQSPPAADKQTNQAAWQGMAGLEAWVSEKMETVGFQETVDLIHMYAANGRFSAEVETALLEFTAFRSGNYRDVPTQPSRSAVFNPAPAAPQNARAKKVQPAPVRSVPAAAPPTPAKSPTPAKPPKVKASAAPNNKAKSIKPKVETTDAVDESSHNVVLKLIAGIQNAGAGVRWGKHDG